MNVFYVGFKAPETFRDRLDRYAKRKGIGRAEAMRRLITEGLDRDDVARREARIAREGGADHG